MLTHRHFEIVQELMELEPARDYAKRGAAAVASIWGTGIGYRLELSGKTYQSEPSPVGAATLSIAIDGSSEQSGVLHLFGPTPSEQDLQQATWGARLFERGLKYSARLQSNSQPRTYEDIQVMLRRTPLTPRERDVVGRLLSGASTRQIADSTGLTVATVNTYLKRIFAKLGVHSRVELVARVTGTRGVIPSGPMPDARNVTTPPT